MPNGDRHDNSGFWSEIDSPKPFVAELIDRLAPAYLPQVQGIAVQSLADVVEAEIAKGKLESANDVLTLMQQSIEIYRDVARKTTEGN